MCFFQCVGFKEENCFLSLKLTWFLLWIKLKTPITNHALKKRRNGVKHYGLYNNYKFSILSCQFKRYRNLFFFAISHRNVFYHVNLSWSSLLSCTGSHYPTKIGCIMAITHVVFFFWHEFTCWNLQLSHVSKIYIILIFKRFCLLSQSICFLGKLLKLFVCVVNYFYDE